MEDLTQQDLEVSTLGSCLVPSPLPQRPGYFVNEDHRVLLPSDIAQIKPSIKQGKLPLSFEPAGRRPKIFFKPSDITCGIVTCGGLCPGLNDVIRSLVMTLTYTYGVPRILGFRYGYAGLSPKNPYEPLSLTPEVVDDIHEHGGTILGSSRGPQESGDMVDTLVKKKISILFVIGGDGTLRGAQDLSRNIARRKLPISIIGIPKTIDNDIAWITQSFGFGSSVEEARRTILAAHAEAKGAYKGIGLVKLMGRHSGFIAAHTTLANCDVNFCLVPEVPFSLQGKGGLLEALDKRFKKKDHAVIVVAEGAGQDLLEDQPHSKHDTSGNIRLKDIGVFLRDQIKGYFSKQGQKVSIKYIDPSYIIRSVSADSQDSEYCLLLGQQAVHAGMAGRTNMLIGFWNQHFTHVPIPLTVGRRKQIDPQGPLWQSVLEATGQ